MALNGALFTIGLWFDQSVPSLLTVGDALVAAGGRYTGDVTVVPPDLVYADWFDGDVRRSVDRRVVEGRAPGTVEGTVFALVMRLPAIGVAHVGYAGTPDEAKVEEHPVEITMNADLVGFSFDRGERKERNQARARVRAFLRTMKTLCAGLDPAYATMGEEITVDAPAALASGRASLSSHAFVSHRLAVHPEVGLRLAELAPLCTTRDWGTGTHFEWGPARTQKQQEALWAANRAASVAIGRASRVR